MSTTEKIWIIAGLATLARSMGLVVCLREIIYRVNRIPVHNTLRRNHNDIQLEYIEPIRPNQLEYIEPVRPNHIYQPLDIETLNYESYNWGDRLSTYWSDRVPTYYSGQLVPSYYTGGNPPSYNIIDRGFINSSLEDNINLSILWYEWLKLYEGRISDWYEGGLPLKYEWTLS